MYKILIAILVFILSFTLLNCADEKEQFTKMEKELIDQTLTTLQLTAAEFIQDDTQFLLFESVMHLKGMSFFAYSMVLYPDGKVIAHSEAVKAIGILEDEITKKVLENRDPSMILMQKTVIDNREVMDFSLPVFSKSEPHGYLGAVRLAIFVN